MFTMDKNLKIHSYIYLYLFFHFVLYIIFVHTYDIEEKSIQLDQAWKTLLSFQLQPHPQESVIFSLNCDILSADTN